MKRLIVTADDFGLSENINLGISQSVKEGIVTSTSLLINAPATDHALSLLKDLPSLQVGLHLGIVESYQTANRPELKSRYNYFGLNKNCLPRDWKEYLFTRSFRNEKLLWQEEFEAQVQKFLKVFPSVPFLNSTQHLHLVPHLFEVVLSLCKKYRIPWVRMGNQLIYSGKSSSRPVHSWGIIQLSKLNFSQDVKSTDCLLGADLAGKLNIDSLSQLLKKVPHGLSELVVHPGFGDDALRKLIPGTYGTFNWDAETRAMISPEIITLIAENGIHLETFGA